MRNTVMTGPIILSKEDSSRLRQNILHPTVEYLQEQERYFEEIASSMIIHKEGSNTRVEFKDLDLSNLDLMIEKEKKCGTSTSSNASIRLYFTYTKGFFYKYAQSYFK